MKIIIHVPDDQAPKVTKWLNGVGIKKAKQQRFDLNLTINSTTHDLSDVEFTGIELDNVPEFQIGDVVKLPEPDVWGRVIEIEEDTLLVRLSAYSAARTGAVTTKVKASLAENMFP